MSSLISHRLRVRLMAKRRMAGKCSTSESRGSAALSSLLPTVFIRLFQLIKQVLKFNLGNTLLAIVFIGKRGKIFTKSAHARRFGLIAFNQSFLPFS